MPQWWVCEGWSKPKFCSGCWISLVILFLSGPVLLSVLVRMNKLTCIRTSYLIPICKWFLLIYFWNLYVNWGWYGPVQFTWYQSRLTLSYLFYLQVWWRWVRLLHRHSYFRMYSCFISLCTGMSMNMSLLFSYVLKLN